MTTPTRQTEAGERFDRVVELFAPYVMKAVTQELDSLLAQGFSLERIDAIIGYVEEYKAGRLKKAFALHVLKRKRKQIAKGKLVTLTKREREVILGKMETSLPPRVVRAWLQAITASSTPTLLSEFDDAMLPADAEIMQYKKEFALFGIESDSIRNILREIRTVSGGMPQPVITYLEQFGFVDDLS